MANGLIPFGALVAILTAGSLAPGSHQAASGRATPPFAPWAATVEDFSPSWSPDGKLIVFSRHEGRWIHLYIASVDGGQPRPLLTDEHVYTQPDWSRDGRIVFSSNRSGRSQIWTVKTDGTDLKQITNLPGSPNVQPRWSPDARQIAFVSYPGPRVMIVPVDGGAPRPVAAGVWPAWSPDGKRLAYGAADALGAAHKEYELLVIPGGDHGFVTTGLAEAMESAMRFLVAKLHNSAGR